MIVEAASDEAENDSYSGKNEYVNVPIEENRLKRIVKHGLGKNSLGSLRGWFAIHLFVCAFSDFERERIAITFAPADYEA